MRWALSAGIAAAVILAAAVFFLRQPASKKTAADSLYVNSAACAGCHAGIAESYRRTGMARSFFRPSVDTVKAGTFYHKASDSFVTMSERGGLF